MRAPLTACLLALTPAVAVADCATERDLILALLGASVPELTDQGLLSEDGDTCRIGGAVLQNSDVLRIDLGTISWRLDGLEAMGRGAGKVALDFGIENARLVPDGPDPWISYMLDQQNLRNFIDARLVGAWDLDAGIIRFDEVSLDLHGNNGLRSSWSVDGFSPDIFRGDIAAFENLRLRSLDLEVQNQGYLDGLILGYLVGLFSDVPGSPETVVDATKAELIEVISIWPDAVFDADSRSALIALVEAGPVPWGRVFVEMESVSGLGVNALMNNAFAADLLSPATMESAFDGASFTIRFTPATLDE